MTRRLIQELLIAGPLILILGIGVDSRTRASDYEPQAYSAEMNRLIQAYVEPVRRAQAALEVEPLSARREAVHRVAEEWIEGSDAGVLRPLREEYYGDSFRDGVKYEIGSTVETLCAHLNQDGERLEEQGRYVEAAESYVLAIRLAQVLKHSDLTTIGTFSSQQRHALLNIERVAPELPAKVALELRDRLRAWAASEPSIIGTVIRARRNYFRESARMGVARQQIEEPATFVSASQMLVGKTDPAHVNVQLSRLLMASEGGLDSSYVPQVRFAWASERLMSAQASRCLEALAMTSRPGAR